MDNRWYAHLTTMITWRLVHLQSRTSIPHIRSLLLWSISVNIFHHFIQLQTFSLFISHTHNSQITKTRSKTTLYTRWKPHRWSTASTTHLFNNPRTFKGHVEFLNHPIHHHLVDPSMLFDHILNLLREISCGLKHYNGFLPTNWR